MEYNKERCPWCNLAHTSAIFAMDCWNKAARSCNFHCTTDGSGVIHIDDCRYGRMNRYLERLKERSHQ